MNAAAFFLAVNFVIALSFAVVFVVVSTRSRSRTASLWFAAGFAIASLSAIFELMVAYAGLTKLWAVSAFATVLSGMILLRIGVGDLYGRTIPLWLAVCFLAGSILVDLAIYDLQRGTVLHAFSYQSPFALVLLSSAAAVLSSTRRLVVDRVLGILILVTGLHFFAKAGLSVVAGAGRNARDYIHSPYALISQSSTAVLMVAVGLTLLSVLVLQIMADERSNSERDALSGLPNRRGFENGVRSARSHTSGGRDALITCDLDHFKAVNDTYGHHAGDLVIRGFSDLLVLLAPKSAILGRMGGEEFAIFLPDTTAEVATLLAQALGGGARKLEIAALPPSFRFTASFGVAELSTDQELADALRDADVALYEAKRAGRDCVRQSGPAISGGQSRITAVK